MIAAGHEEDSPVAVGELAQRLVTHAVVQREPLHTRGGMSRAEPVCFINVSVSALFCASTIIARDNESRPVAVVSRLLICDPVWVGRRHPYRQPSSTRYHRARSACRVCLPHGVPSRYLMPVRRRRRLRCRRGKATTHHDTSNWSPCQCAGGSAHEAARGYARPPVGWQTIARARGRKVRIRTRNGTSAWRGEAGGW